ncbi:hypothetical protein ACFW5M_33930 [Streptomyces albogriseolus]|uniref:hypothetical protein n=1 Tax=Streptomyces albogriseolus TaxID=1887 RepID=UPI0036BD9220
MPKAQYSSVVFPLMFWKYLSDTWEHHHQEFLDENDLDSLSAEKPARSSTATTSRSRSRPSTPAPSPSVAPPGRPSWPPSPSPASASGFVPPCRPSRRPTPTSTPACSGP